MTEPARAMTDMFKFLLNTESLEGTCVEKRINEVCLPREVAQGDSQTTQTVVTSQTTYKPRSGKINTNLRHYDQGRMNILYETNYDMIERYGYMPYFEQAGYQLHRPAAS